jgi:hypothetical protein
LRNITFRWGFSVSAATWAAFGFASDIPLDHPSGVGGDVEGVRYGPEIIIETTTAEAPFLPETERKRPYPSRGIYLSYYTVANREKLEYILGSLDGSPINTLVIDLKEIPGIIAWPTEHPIARETGAASKLIPDLEALTDELHGRGYYLIARFVVFPDDELAGYAGGTYAVKDAYKGGGWKDKRGFRWVSMWHPTVWDYNLDLAEEAVTGGFDEVQFDYVRFPTDEGADAAAIPFWPAGTPKEEAITGFVRTAAERLRPLGAQVGVDAFGFSCLYEKRNPEGQDVDDMAPYVDVFHPMAYPSHYGPVFYGKLPLRRRPYAIVYNTVKVGRKRVEPAGALVQPFIQGFSAGSAYYDAAYIFDQMVAAEDAGAVGWIIWNADNIYTMTYEALKLYGEYRYENPWRQRPFSRLRGAD